jgi:gas vesicle protein
MSSSTEDFFKGLVIGAAVGTVAGILLAPKSGQETREDIKKFALDVSNKAQDLYVDSRKKVEAKIKDLKAAGKNIDFDAYKKLVSNVIDELKNDSEVASDTAKKIGEQLNKDWSDIKETIA